MSEIEAELRATLWKIDRRLNGSSSLDIETKLLIAKANVLMALQKYEKDGHYKL